MAPFEMDETYISELNTHLGNFIHDSSTGGGLVYRPEPFLLPDDLYLHDLAFEELQYFPRVLCDAAICGRTTITDHFMYWGWTYYLLNGTTPSEGFFEHPLSTPLIEDILSIIPLAFLHLWDYELSEMRKKEMKEQMNDWPPNRGKSLIKWVQERYPKGYTIDRVLTKFGFSLLERLARDRCEQVDERGVLDVPDEKESKFEEYTGRWNQVKYYDVLELWKDHNAAGPTAEYLEEIFDLDTPSGEVPSYSDALPEMIVDATERMPVEQVDEVYDERIASKMDNDEEHFFFVLKELRNLELHGEINVQRRLSTVLLTLCCSVFWDAITIEQYGERRALLNEGRGFRLSNKPIYYPWIDASPMID